MTACLCVAAWFSFQVFLPLEEDKNDVKERFILYLEQLVQVPRGAVEGVVACSCFPGVGRPAAAVASMPGSLLLLLNFKVRHSSIPQERAAEMGQDSQDPFGIGMPPSNQGMHASMGGAFTAQSYDSSEVLPFELHVLEAALGEVRVRLRVSRGVESAGCTALSGFDMLRWLWVG